MSKGDDSQTPYTCVADQNIGLIKRREGKRGLEKPRRNHRAESLDATSHTCDANGNSRSCLVD